MSEWYEISRTEYESRFRQRFTPAAEKNYLGYGPGNKFVPPLYKPEQFGTIVERHNLLLSTGGPIFLYYYLVDSIVWDGMISGETWDMFWYNNAKAVGTQAYPQGIFKYFDFFSIGGFFVYVADWAYAFFSTLFCWLTLFIPLDIWVAMFDKKWDNFYVLFIPPDIGHFSGIEIERGWTMG